ncbi:MAG: hypothetical protein ACHREM_00505 [Polyangiales bacterium]
MSTDALAAPSTDAPSDSDDLILRALLEISFLKRTRELSGMLGCSAQAAAFALSKIFPSLAKDEQGLPPKDVAEAKRYATFIRTLARREVLDGLTKAGVDVARFRP